MKKIFLSLVAVFLLFGVSTTRADNNSDRYIPDRIIVKLKSSIAPTIRNNLSTQRTVNLLHLLQGLSQYRVKKISPVIRNFQNNNHSKRLMHGLEAHATKESDLGRIFTIELDLQSGQTFEKALEAYKNNPDIEYAEPDYYVTIDSTPNDPVYYAQWSLSKIEAAKAWDIYTGNRNTIVAVIDTGVDYNHPDLLNNMWVNKAELNGTEGVDDDKNGYIDDIHGYNFIYRNSDPIDDYGHGTHCAGVIAAEGNNNRDISGICWNASIMALKFIGSLGNGSVSDAVLAHYYAVEAGADVISNSWSLSEDSQALRDVINYANSQGVIVVAAAGNYNSSTVRYPAAFENVISVAATNTIDSRWYYSSYGNWVDIAAPGMNILSLLANGTITGTPYNDYITYLSGTSTACPHIAGACALLLSANPYLTPSQVENILTRTTDPLPNGICSSGRLNLYKAIQEAVPSQGYISFDRSYYTSNDTINILLVDNNLKENTSQTISVMTSNINDLEDIILTQTEPGLGVFTGKIHTSSETPIQKDGTLQTGSGQVVTAIYFDTYTGSDTTPEPATTTAYIDSESPVLEQIQVETQNRNAIITFQTNEPTKAELYYNTADANSYSYSKDNLIISETHTITLQPLALNTNYKFVIDLYDKAGNYTIADNNGYGYSFSTSPEYIEFIVPDNYPTIQAAIDDASDGDTIIVTDGIYTGEGNYDIDFKGKSVTLKSENGPKNCIIDCSKFSRAFDFHRGEDANSILYGFTIQNGSIDDYGGAIICSVSSPTIKNCIFLGNYATEYGGAIMNIYSSSPVIYDCIFQGNSVGSGSSSIANGGAICNMVNSSATIVNCTFKNNWAIYSGGAIYNEENCNPTIIKCNFNTNNAQHGGAIYNYNNCNPLITNSIMSKNSAQYGGAIKNSEAQVTLINCTLTENYGDLGGGIWNAWNGASELLNCILWNNSDQYGKSEAAQIDGSPVLPGMTSPDQPVTKINYCCIEGLSGNTGGIGNISDDPLFYNPDSNDYHLKSQGWRWSEEQQSWNHDDVTSHCIDAGNPGSPLFDEPVNIDGDISNHWGRNVRINIGAYGGTAEASIAQPDFRLLADINNDGIVNIKDYAIQTRFNAQNSETSDERLMTSCEYGDLDRNGQTTLADIAILSNQWLQTSNQ
ncbi:MAG: S8 family serine peptidase [Sedimentisphaerales bacterium]|nr:S8 family serine peptidase [Sedimentisphaerales bacterium]